jgi:hypothetical protein
LGTLFSLKTLGAAKKLQLIFWIKISTGSPWNLGHSLLAENFACGEKTTVDFLEQISTGSPWNLGHSLLAENFVCGKKMTFDFLEQNFHRLSMES